MSKRKRPGYVDDFAGLNINESPFSIGPQFAQQADDVIVESGQIEARPGRVELTENQLDPSGTLGLHNYNPPSGSLRSLIIVTPDGIYQRSG
jgi:hypothetical protein